ncbi:MAG: glycosyltransferase family 4 protein [Verrucomicrobiaceae bacterium]|nr:glycosyltransferase family 4 protein [Verrucomicrobiaceae bacterium]
MKINAYCESKGWLFDDLKREFADSGAVVSDSPLSGADAYICIRSGEFRKSPKPERTVVQVHDMRRYRVEGAGCVSLVHPAQRKHFAGFGGKITMQPIGSRSIEAGQLPNTATIGFFCREVGGLKGSSLFAEAVRLARAEAKFDVLLIGWELDTIQHLGRYERKAAGPADYRRITALATCSVSPMIPLSAYEACAAGRMVVTTPRVWPGGSPWAMVRTAADATGLAAVLRTAVATPQLFPPEKPFCRRRWILEQIEEAKNLCV